MDFVQRFSASRRERDDAIPVRESVVWDEAVNIVENRTGRLFVSLHGTDVVDTTKFVEQTIGERKHSRRTPFKHAKAQMKQKANKKVENDVKPERGSRLAKIMRRWLVFYALQGFHPNKGFKAPLMCVRGGRMSAKQKQEKRIKNAQPASIFN